MDIAIWIAIAAVAAALAAHYTHKALRADRSRTVVLDARDAAPGDYRQRVCAWLREQGLDPEVVRRVEIRDRTAVVTEFALGPDGQPRVNKKGDDVLTFTKTVLVSSVPASRPEHLRTTTPEETTDGS